MMLPGSLELAYLGDAVWELYVRRQILDGGGHVHAMHKKAVSRVNASAQAQALEKLLPDLTEPEADVVRRARNARQTPTKNADLRDYHMATAFEALLGYLSLTRDLARLDAVLAAAYGAPADPE